MYLHHLYSDCKKGHTLGTNEGFKSESECEPEAGPGGSFLPATEVTQPWHLVHAVC